MLEQLRGTDRAETKPNKARRRSQRDFGTRCGHRHIQHHGVAGRESTLRPIDPRHGVAVSAAWPRLLGRGIGGEIEANGLASDLMHGSRTHDVGSAP